MSDTEVTYKPRSYQRDLNDWKLVQHKIKRPKIYPVRSYWDGYDISGRERWYVELNDGRVIHQRDPEYSFWYKKIKPSIKINTSC